MHGCEDNVKWNSIQKEAGKVDRAKIQEKLDFGSEKREDS